MHDFIGKATLRWGCECRECGLREDRQRTGLLGVRGLRLRVVQNARKTDVLPGNATSSAVWAGETTSWMTAHLTCFTCLLCPTACSQIKLFYIKTRLSIFLLRLLPRIYIYILFNDAITAPNSCVKQQDEQNTTSRRVNTVFTRKSTECLAMIFTDNT